MERWGRNGGEERSRWEEALLVVNTMGFNLEANLY